MSSLKQGTTDLNNTLDFDQNHVIAVIDIRQSNENRLIRTATVHEVSKPNVNRYRARIYQLFKEIMSTHTKKSSDQTVII